MYGAGLGGGQKRYFQSTTRTQMLRRAAGKCCRIVSYRSVSVCEHGTHLGPQTHTQAILLLCMHTYTRHTTAVYTRDARWTARARTHTHTTSHARHTTRVSWTIGYPIWKTLVQTALSILYPVNVLYILDTVTCTQREPYITHARQNTGDSKTSRAALHHKSST